MLKFLMENRCSITIKELKGDTVKDCILRNTFKDTIMIDAYMKYEDKMIIQKIISVGKDAFIQNVKAFFRWRSPRFIKLFLSLSYEIISKDYHLRLIGGFYGLTYLIHWIFFNGEYFHYILSCIYHFGLLLLVLSLIIFTKSEAGSVEKLHIQRDIDTNVIGQILYLIKEK
jgi:hypothetical protein